MIISTEAEKKTFNKIQHTFIKTTRIKRELHQSDKGPL